MASGRLNPVAWTEGMFLRPQHFQQHDAFLEENLRYHLYTLNPYHWGVRALSLNEEALADHRFEIQQLEAVMPSGTVVKSGVNAVVKPRQFDPTVERFSVYIAMRNVSDSEAGVRAAQGDDDDARYQIVETELPDRTRAGAVAPVDLAFPNLRIFVSGEEQELELYEWFKLAEIEATGVQPPFRLAADYCPPLLAVQSFAPLADRLDEFIAQAAAKMRAVAGDTNTMAKIELKKYFIRYTLARITPLLRHLLSTGVTSPFQLYTALVDAAGSLAAFNLGEPVELPPYRHDDLLRCFYELLTILDENLQQARPDRFTELPLGYDAAKKLYFTDALNADLVDPRKHYYLAARSELEAEDLVGRIVKEAKIGAPSTVRVAMVHNTGAVPISHMPGAPTDIDPRVGFEFFSIEPRDKKWKKVQEEYEFAVSLPNVESAQLYLYVVDGEH